MSDSAPPDPSGLRPVPAIGPVEWRGPRRTAALLAVVVTVALALLAVRASGVLREESPLPPLPEVAAVAPGIVRGAEPTDADLQRLRDDYDVRAVVAVGGSSVEAQAATQALGMALHDVAVIRPPRSAGGRGLRVGGVLRQSAPAAAGTAVVTSTSTSHRYRSGGRHDAHAGAPRRATAGVGARRSRARRPGGPDTSRADSGLPQVAAAPRRSRGGGPYAALSGVRL